MIRPKLLIELARLKSHEHMKPARIKRYQEKKLRKILVYAFRHSSYYHRAFVRAGIDESIIRTAPLSAFPVIDKQTLLHNFDQLITVPDLTQDELRRFDAETAADRRAYKGKYHVVHSSGSTGKPGYFVYGEAAWRTMLLGIIRAALWGMPMKEIIKLLGAGPRIAYIAATDGRYGGAMAVGNGIDGVGAAQIHLDIKQPLEQWVAELNKFKPDIIIGYPSAIKILCELVEQGRVKLSAMRVISCGEPLGAGLRRYLEKVLGGAVINVYGASESLALGVDDGNWMLLFDEDMLWFEDGFGHRDFLHPLAIEGFCVEGPRDYQFLQTSRDSFVMIAEKTSQGTESVIQTELTAQMRGILEEKGLEYVRFQVTFVEEILPDPRTGKKQLIVKKDAERWRVAG